MKKLALCLLLIATLLLPLKGKVLAACQSDDNSYGAVTLQAPTLPSAGSYTVWTRLQVPSTTSNQYRLEINNSACYEVGGKGIEVGKWSWVSFQDNEPTRKISYDFEKASGNSLKLIGTNAGVKVDRILLVKTDCIPVDLGTNCESSGVAATVSTAGATEVPPPTSSEVSGLIVASTTVSQNPGTISKVVYFADSNMMPTATGFALDTTLLSNGAHRITMQITKLNGTVINEATTLQVSNKQNAFSPLKRWVRLNQSTAVLLSSIIGGALVVAATLLIVRHMKLNKRLLEFRGF